MTYTGEGGGVGGWEEVVLDKRQGFADQGGGLGDSDGDLSLHLGAPV